VPHPPLHPRTRPESTTPQTIEEPGTPVAGPRRAANAVAPTPAPGEAGPGAQARARVGVGGWVEVGD